MGNCLRIKICGVTNLADAVLAAQLGADAVGLNFYPASPRHVTVNQAAEIIRALPPFVEPVGVFVNTAWRQIAATAKTLALRVVQCLNEEKFTAPPPSPIRRIEVYRIKDAQALQDVRDLIRLARKVGSAPAAILLDAYSPDQYGGTGKTAPWELLADFQPELPLILAGGLNHDNVAKAIRKVRPWAVDVASGVESSPGKKDPEKMKRFIEAARKASGAR